MKKAPFDVLELSMQTDIPTEEVKVSGRNIKLFGPSNAYFKLVEEAFEVSPTNACIVQNVQQQIYGKGLAATDTEDLDSVFELIPKEELMKICYDYGKFYASALQVAYTGSGEQRRVSKVTHLPIETIGMGMKNNKGEILNYYYCADWSRAYYLKITQLPAFGTSKKNLELLYISNYSSGMHYFSKVGYHSGLKHALSEGKMSDFILNKISHGFNPTLLLNFNNGVPSQEQQQLLKSKIKKQYEGPDGDNFIISFQESADQASTIDGVDQPDAFQQYHWVSTEATQKIILAHRIVSPMLVGIKDNTGLGNNAEELKSAYQLHNATIIRPKQDHIIEGLNQILTVNGIEHDLYFETLMPAAYTEVDEVEKTDEVEKETGIDSNEPNSEGSSSEARETELSSEEWEWDSLMEALAQPAPEGYEFEREEDCDDEEENVNYEALINEFELANVSSNDSNPTKKSNQDSPLFIVRYTYKKTSTKTPKESSREFCRKVLSLRGQNRFFRKEDINFMSTKGVNREFGHKKQNYSIWLHKGGVYCHHGWVRVIFRKKLQKNGEPYKGNPMQNVYRSNETAAGLDPQGPEKVAPIDTPRRGHHPNYTG